MGAIKKWCPETESELQEGNDFDETLISALWSCQRYCRMIHFPVEEALAGIQVLLLL